MGIETDTLGGGRPEQSTTHVRVNRYCLRYLLGEVAKPGFDHQADRGIAEEVKHSIMEDESTQNRIAFACLNGECQVSCVAVRSRGSKTYRVSDEAALDGCVD